MFTGSGYDAGVSNATSAHDPAAIDPASDPAWRSRDPRQLAACLTVAELCAWLRLEKVYVIRKAVRAGVLAHLRIGKHIRFAPEHVAAAMAHFEVPAAPVPRPGAGGVDGLVGVPGLSRRSRAAHVGPDQS